MPPIVLSIAGFDPSSGAGVTADLKTISAHGCYGVACITALTVQSTQGVVGMEPVSGELVRDTLNELTRDMTISAVRIGMLGSAEVANAVADFLRTADLPNIVLDPVVQSSSGAELLDAKGVEVVRTRLLGMAEVITPNLEEAAFFSNLRVINMEDMKESANELRARGCRNVLISGGHLPENVDLLLLESGETHEIPGERVVSMATHGSGCALATALACNLANGMGLLQAAKKAKEFVRQAIEAAYPVGKGNGPMNHLFRLK